MGRALFAIVAVAVMFTLGAGSCSVAGFDSSEHQAPTGDEQLASGPPVQYRYRNYSEIRSILLQVAAENPGISSIQDIGDSWEKTESLADRDILAIKISDNVEVDEQEPEMLIMALHHAREWPTSEVAIELVLNLTDRYGTDPQVSWIVDNREIWIVPVVNPDGLDYALTTDDMWRKNRRNNLDGTFGVDLNRNYNGSQNGDPLGEWGGVGTSDLTSSDIYCGDGPFSEPETQAIRDLVLSRDFEIAFDFHTHGDLVCWPWGYTLDPAPDDAVLASIGTQLAAVNGYTPEQSSELYETTGDSLDWLYGGADIYPILFEMGGEFHPNLMSEVTEIISENIPASLLGLELAGDRELMAFSIEHMSIEDRSYAAEGAEVTVVVVADRGVDESQVQVHYRVNDGEWEVASLTKDSVLNDTYSCRLPAAPGDSVVEYYISALDLGGVALTEPRYAPYDTHTFYVEGVSSPPVADAGPDQVVLVGTTVAFDGSESSDDVNVESYTWTIVSVDSASMDGVTAEYLFVDIGEYEVVLTVSDVEGQSDSDAMSVLVYDDIPPVADAGENRTVLVGTSVVFSGEGSTDNDEIANYTWEFLYGGEMVTLYGVAPVFTFGIEGEFLIALNVTDEAGNTDSDLMIVTVEPEDVPEPGGASSTSLLLVGVAAAVALVAVLAVLFTRARRA